MAEKTLTSRLIMKHDTTGDWQKATNFTPKQGELIVYDSEDASLPSRIKIGNGTTNVNSLPFATISQAATGSASLPVYWTGASFNTVSTLGIANGGTGATTATDARTKLGAAAVNHTHTASQISGLASTSIYEKYLAWGGKAISGDISPIDAAMSYLHNANRAQFANPAGITVEYSTDSGSTWMDYGLSDAQKIYLVSGIGASLSYGKKSSSATNNDQLRITINAHNCGFYTALKTVLINFSTNGATGCSVLVERALGGSPTTFSTVGTYSLSGWTGWNSIPFYTSLGGYDGQTSQYWVLRFTFSATAMSSSGGPCYVFDMQFFGTTSWITPSNMARTGHLYSWDYAQNASFPANITTSKTITGGYLAASTSTTTPQITISNAAGLKYTGIETSTSNVDRKVWFSDGSTDGTPVVSANFKYNPSTNVLTVGSITGKAKTADAFSSNRSISLTGDITGTASATGSNGWSIATSVGSGKITNSMLSGSISNDKLTNHSISIAGNTIDLGGSIDVNTLATSIKSTFDGAVSPAWHQHNPADLTNGLLNSNIYITSHPEDNLSSIIPFINNDIAFLTERGGSVSAYTTTDTDYTSPSLTIATDYTTSAQLDKLTDAAPTYCVFWLNAKTDVLVIDLTMPTDYTFEYSSKFYIDFGAWNWSANTVQLYLWNDDTTNAEQAYTLVGEGSSIYRAWYKSASYTWYTDSAKTTVPSNGYAFNKVRFVLKDWATTSYRVAQIGILNYNSKAQRVTTMSRGIDDEIYRNISAAKDRTYNLGSTDKYWNTIYSQLLRVYNTGYGDGIIVQDSTSPSLQFISDSGSVSSRMALDYGKFYMMCYDELVSDSRFFTVPSRSLAVCNSTASSDLTGALQLREVTMVDGSAVSTFYNVLHTGTVFYADTLPETGTEGQICFVPV